MDKCSNENEETNSNPTAHKVSKNKTEGRLRTENLSENEKVQGNLDKSDSRNIQTNTSGNERIESKAIQEETEEKRDKN